MPIAEVHRTIDLSRFEVVIVGDDAEPTEPKFCGGCGREVAEVFGEDELGRCCHNLPHPWHRGSDGLYNRTSDHEDHPDERDEDDDEEEPESPEPPHCPNCGSTEWDVTVTQRVDTSQYEEPDGTNIWYDWQEFDNATAICAHCTTDMPRYFDLVSC